MSKQDRRVYLITGASSGLGYFTAKVLARSDPESTVVIAQRTKPMKDLPRNVVMHSLDLTSTSGIQGLIDNWTHGQVSAVLFNAAILPVGEPEFTPEGIEKMYAATQVGHARLFFLLNQAGLLRDDAKLLFTSSPLHDPASPGIPSTAHWSSPEALASATGDEFTDPKVRYSTAKLANVFFALALARHAKEQGKAWDVVIYDPGWIPAGGSKLNRYNGLAGDGCKYTLGLIKFLAKQTGSIVSSPAASAKIYAEIANGKDRKYAGASGRHYRYTTPMPTSTESQEIAKQEELWKWTVYAVAKDVEQANHFAVLA